MPIHPHHLVAHVHIPKTAGTSIGSLFESVGDFRARNDHWYGHAERDGRHYELQHLTHAELTRLSGHRYDSFATFAVVRDPYQRLISEFHWRRAVAGNEGSFIRAFEAFDEFMAAVPLDLDHAWEQYISLADQSHANLLIHLRPQWQYLCDASGDRVESIEVVRFEQLADELNELLGRWNVDARLTPRPKRPASIADHFTRETLAVANQVYARDFDWFGYPMLTEPV